MECKAQNKDDLLIFCVSLYGNRLKKSTKILLPVDKWDAKKQQVKKSHPKSVEINAYLTYLKSKTEDIYFNNLRKENFAFDAFKSIVEDTLFPTKKEEEEEIQKDVLVVFEEYLNARSIEVSKGTVKRIKVLQNHLKNYELKAKQTLTFDSLDIPFFEKLRAYLLTEVKLTNNTLARYIKSVKTFLNWCVEREYTDNLQYKKFKLKSEKTIVIYLTEDEFRAIHQLDLEANQTLAKVRDVFCFGCFTGQRYSDIAALKRSNIRDNVWYLNVQKTKDVIKIPLTKAALVILDKYKDLDKPLPVFTNQRTNLHLKEIGKLAGIDEIITYVRYRGAERIEIQEEKYNFISTHTARKTFVTLSMEAGMTNPEIMAITGHKDLKTLQKYTGSNHHSIKLKMDAIWNKNAQSQ